MLDRSRVLLLGALFVGAVPIASPASADMVLTADGKWQPLEGDAKANPPVGDDEPSNELLSASDEFKVDATYETVKSTKNFTRPAGQVQKIIAHESIRGTFQEAFKDAGSSFFTDAAEKFKAAADELTGFGKQAALYYRVQALLDAGLIPLALVACDDLIAAFPKSFYLCDVQIIRAKVAASENSAAAVDNATKLLAVVANAPGMNNRDLFRAEWTRIALTLEARRKFDEAEKAYRELVAKIEKTDAAMGSIVRQQANVGIGNCLVAGRKDADARGFFEKATESRNPDVLAGAYLGLGNVALSEAKSLKDGDKRAEAKAKLEEAVLHYLRVTTYYKQLVSDSSPVLDAAVNQARVFVALFEMSGNKDCDIAIRAERSWRELLDMPSVGGAKSGFIREFKAFFEKKTAACSPK